MSGVSGRKGIEEPAIKFKGRGSMKYREKKNWTWGNRGGYDYGRL